MCASRIAGGFAAACVFFACAPAASIAAQRTTATVYRTWTPAGNLSAGVRVRATISGHCWIESIVTNRPDAYRCMSDNSIFDPCFASSGANNVVACVPNPFSNRVVLMRLQKPLPKVSGDDAAVADDLRPHAQPWGLRLTNGDTCTFATGATDVVHGERLNYACSGSDGWIVGLPDRSAAVWTAQSSDYPKKHLRRVSISQAIF